MNNLQQLMQMGRQLQERMSKLQEELAERRFSATSGGGMVTATVDGKGEVRELKIDAAVVDPADVEMLEDLILAATSEAQNKARSAYEAEIKQAAGGLPLPGLF